MPMEEFKEMWDNEEIETPGGGTAIINQRNVEVVEVVYEESEDK